MEHILNLGTGEGVFHLHEINVGDVSPVLFASVPVNISSDPVQQSIDLQKQAHIQHQCALMRRELKALYLLYKDPDFENITLSVSNIYSFESFLKGIASNAYPDIRLTREGIHLLGAINAKVRRQKASDSKKKDFSSATEPFTRPKSKHPFIVDTSTSKITGGFNTRPSNSLQPISFVSDTTFLPEQ